MLLSLTQTTLQMPNSSSICSLVLLMQIYCQVRKWTNGFSSSMETWSHLLKTLMMQISFDIHSPFDFLNLPPFTTMNVIQNLGSFFFYILIVFLLMLLIPILRIIGLNIRNRHFHRILVNLNKEIYYNTLLRLILESYIILAISGFLHLNIVNFQI